MHSFRKHHTLYASGVVVGGIAVCGGGGGGSDH